ncbi:hypothetical protein BCON_0297g00140 [Botryotinia convoluta]|uniref:NmrA-like domain-containing protein n=1 Tax=Botryotinia convoluta TaxID=54673 RepID=A0A4Z1HDJ9_9HELO|nr:hypothetical protein BCON_0297g00140 [Botryotinia convoluta]
MVKIVLAGGAGNVGREILEALLAEGKHEIKVFSRKDVPDLTTQGVTVDIVDYIDKKALVDALEGVDTVLSFIVTINDPDNRAQKTLIDACIEAGVRRFAPSEWAARSHCGIPAYEGKDRVLEFTLFQCGLFLNYFTYPHPSAKFMQIFPMPIDVENCKAIIHKDTKAQITLTSVQDLARVVRQSFVVESVEKSDLEKGIFTSSWFPVIAQPGGSGGS